MSLHFAAEEEAIMDTEVTSSKSLYMDPTWVEAIGSDPGPRNYGIGHVKLIGVSHMIGIDGPYTRTLVPRFLIKMARLVDLEAVNLTPFVPTPDDEDANSKDEHGKQPVSKLSDLIDKDDLKSMGHWRAALAVVLGTDCKCAFEPYHSPLTGQLELPAVASENQLDVSENLKWKREIAILLQAKARLGAFVDTSAYQTLDDEVKQIIYDMAHDRKITVRDPDEFNRGRMYNLSQIFLATVQAIDAHMASTGSVYPQRLVTHHAKKFGIASDGSLSYQERKEATINKVYELLRLQRDSDDVTPEERANGRKWISYLDRIKSHGQKLDDICDAILVALDECMEIYKLYWSRAKQLKPMPTLPRCMMPVTKREIDEQNGRPLSVKKTKTRGTQLTKRGTGRGKKNATIKDSSDESTIDLVAPVRSTTTNKKVKRSSQHCDVNEGKEQPKKKRARKE